MFGPESVLPPGAASGMSDILLRTSCCKISLPLRNAPGGNTDSGPAHTYFRHSSRTCSGADANLVARQSRALIWGGRSQSSGLTNFPIRLSERSRNRTPLLCRVTAGPAPKLLFRTLRRTQETPAARSAQRGSCHVRGRFGGKVPGLPGGYTGRRLQVFDLGALGVAR